jgi:hypothetical protein
VEGGIYILCATTALACGVLLLRGYLRSRARLLLWTGLFFLTLTLENVLLFVDVIIVPDLNLIFVRRGIGIGGVAALLYGLIWETRSAKS